LYVNDQAQLNEAPWFPIAVSQLDDKQKFEFQQIHVFANIIPNAYQLSHVVLPEYFCFDGEIDKCNEGNMAVIMTHKKRQTLTCSFPSSVREIHQQLRCVYYGEDKFDDMISGMTSLDKVKYL
jgi:hypothetical protein